MFKRNLIYLSMVNVYVKLTSLAVIPFIARRFTIEEFGILSLAQVLWGYALDGFDGGIKKIGIRELSKADAQAYPVMANSLFTVRIAMLAAAFLFMNVLGILLFEETRHRLIVLLISLSVLAYIGDITWITDARQEMKFSSVSKVIERSVYLICTIWGIHLVSLNVLAIAYPVSVLAAAAILWRLLHGVSGNIKLSVIRMDYLREGLIIGVSGIAASLCLMVDQLMIKVMLGAHELGLYSAATKTFFMVLTFVWIYAYALFPKLSAASENAKEVCRLLRRHTLFLGAAGTLSVGVLSFLAEPIIRLFFSEKFLVILPVFKALNFFLILVFFNILYADSLNAFDKQRSRLVIVMRGLALNVVLNGILIPSLGLMGAVYASAMAQLLILIMSYGQVKKLYQPRVGLFILAFLLLNLAVIQWSLS